MNCGFTSPIQSDCNDLLKVGGAKKRYWIGNIDDLDKSMGVGGYALDVSGNITQLYFKAYKGLYPFETKKNTVFGGFELVVGEGSNVFNHTFTAKVLKETAEAYATLKDLSVSEVFIIEETNSGLIKVFGIDSGMSVATMVQSDGVNQQADTSIAVTFAGADDDLPRFFLTTDLPTTIGLIETYEIA